MAEATSFPLAWPLGWPRTPPARRVSSQYSVTLDRARKDLMRSIELLGGRHVVLSTDVPLRRDGAPYATAREPADPGVAVYWQQRGEQRVMACDSRPTLRENQRALGLAVDALRALERSGASEVLNRAYSGLAALTSGASWRDVLGERIITLEEAEEAAKRLLIANHPDTGGDLDKFRSITKARDEARAEFGGKS